MNRVVSWLGKPNDSHRTLANVAFVLKIGGPSWKGIVMADNGSKEHFILLLISSWLISIFFFIVFLANAGWPPAIPGWKYDLTYLVVSLGLFLIPFAARIRIGKLFEFERKLDEAKKDYESFKQDTRQMLAAYSNATAIATGNTVNVINNATEGPPVAVSKDGTPDQKPRMPAIALKILNTLWNKQVNTFPDLNNRFTFRINAASPDFLQFREAGNLLMGMELITETDTGQFMLTNKGLKYCLEHYQAFPADMWFGQTKLELEKLTEAKKNIGLI